MKIFLITLALFFTSTVYADELILSPLPKGTCKKHPEVCEVVILVPEAKDNSNMKCLDGILFIRINQSGESFYWKEVSDARGSSVKCKVIPKK